MPWQPKLTSPASFNLGEAFTALITGDSEWSWLLGWVPVIGNPTVDTALFCAAGPINGPPLTAQNFMNLIGSPIDPISKAFLLGGVLQKVAYDRMFGAYCELPVLTGETDVFIGRFTSGAAAGHSFVSGFGWTIPAGCQKIRITVVSTSGSSLTLQLVGYASGSNIANPNPATYSFKAAGFTATSTWSAALTTISAYSGVDGDVVDFWWVVPGSMEQHEPTEQPEPEGVLPPAVRDYPDIAALGEELDRQELKLDLLVAMVRYLAGNLALPPALAPDAEEIEDGVPKSVAGAAGVVIELSNVPASVSEDFGTPVRLHRAGRLAFQTENGYMAAIEITHTPFVIQPLPIGVENVIVNVAPPVTATIRILGKLT